MSDSIFLIHKDQSLSEAVATPYALEKDLQDLLEDHVQLLPGSQIDRDDPPRWQLVKREAGVPLEEGGGGWWAVDHVLVDQNAVPTFVEVKRSKDTRIRREVVAQMLEYVANGTVYWNPGTLRTWYDEAAGGSDKGAETLAEWLQRQDEVPEAVAQEFWKLVDSNLRQGRVRCIFVADEIPASLQRLVEFLNEQLRLVDVLAVEVRQYQADGIKALVPRVIGATVAASAAKSGPPHSTLSKTAWSTDQVVENIRDRFPELVWIPQRIFEWAEQKEGMTVVGGHGQSYPSVTIAWDTERPKTRVRTILAVSGGPNAYAVVEVRLQRMRTTGPYHKEPNQHILLDRLAALGIPRLTDAVQKAERRPGIPMVVISDQQLEGLLSILDHWCDETRKYNDLKQPSEVVEGEET